MLGYKIRQIIFLKDSTYHKSAQSYFLSAKVEHHFWNSCRKVCDFVILQRLWTTQNP